MRVKYKTLFEIRLLHEYFMTKTDGSSVFEQATPLLRQEFIDDIHNENKKSISDHIEFKFPQNLKKLYEGLQLKIIPTFSGFKVVVKVNPKLLADNSLVYEPALPIASDHNIYVLAIRRGINIDEYSNGRIRNEIPGIYFFSNTGNLVAPFLTREIPAYNYSSSYEPGQLALFGANDARQFYRVENVETWHQLSSSVFANESDRILAPLKFDYIFFDSPGIKNASFVLKDWQGAEIKTILASDTTELQKIRLDFSDKSFILLPYVGSLEDKSFVLDVSGTNGYSRRFPLVFGDFFQSESPWAVIHMTPRPKLEQFHYIDAENQLIHDHKRFDIPVKSRSSFWRYRNHMDLELKFEPAKHNGYLSKDGKYLLTRSPIPIFQSFFKLKNDLNNDTMNVPAPIDLHIKTDDKGRMCFDIRVPNSDLFPV